MTDDESIGFYLRQLAVQARSLPLREAVPLLQGALAVAGPHPAVADLRGTFRELFSADDQLELIAAPFTESNLTPKAIHRL